MTKIIDKHRIRKAIRRTSLLLAVMASACSAAAQGILPSLPVVGGLRGTVQNTVNGITATTDRSLGVVRDAVGRPQSAPRRWDHDLVGAPIIRGEIVAISPTPQSLAIARGLSFEVRRSEAVEALGLTVVILEIPSGFTASQAIARLRAADPEGQYDFNHVYNPGGGQSEGSAGETAQEAAPQRIGMIDGGVDRSHSAFRGVTLETAGFVGTCKPVASDHGTAVASLLAGKPRATSLYAADVFCGRAEGGSAEAIVRALGWLASQNVAVVNVSLAGPPNALLAAGVKAFTAKGRVLVAAAGNDGPAAGPRYPAAYPGVVAVTSVDERRSIEIDAGQGDFIAFAAQGVKVAAAKAGGGRGSFTGTSFAAPVVSRRFALLLENPDPQRAASALCALRREAVDLGTPGRDPVFGFGYIGEQPQPPAACLAAGNAH